ncbi:MAG: hypothetical protein LBC56_04865 [Oscillospiraceae bacterium]|nr:hypothetical protein [Oscillospiraceae bacterium]
MTAPVYGCAWACLTSGDALCAIWLTTSRLPTASVRAVTIPPPWQIGKYFSGNRRGLDRFQRGEFSHTTSLHVIKSKF